MTATYQSRLWILMLGLVTVLLGACSANSGGGVDAGGSASSSAKFVEPPPVITMAISPMTLEAGQTATLVWDTTDDSFCSANGGLAGGAWVGTIALANTQGLTVGPFLQSGTYDYVITCDGKGGSTSISRTLTVGAVPPPTINMDLIPSIIPPGSSAVIDYTTVNATKCTGSGGDLADGWQGDQPLQNSAGFSTGVIVATGGYAYELTCDGPGGQTQQTRILAVSAAAAATPPTMMFAAVATAINPGQSITFTWNTNGAKSCAASGGSGSDAWKGSETTSSTGTVIGPIATAGSYSYTLTCIGAGGSVADSLNIDVSASAVPPTVIVDLSVTPHTIAVGSAASLAWSTVNATACTASGSWSGAQPLLGSGVTTGTLTSPGLYSYTLTCLGAGGVSATGTATLTVDAGIGVVTNFVAAPSSIQIGQSTTLAWSSIGATSCTASGGSGTDGWGGQVAISSTGTSVGPIAVPGVYVYALACTGSGGIGVPSTATVIVSTASAASVVAFAATPSTITVGGSASLDWITTGATACTATGGTGSDGWNGTMPTSSTGTSTGAILVAGSYTYTLTCAGPGGTGPSSSVVVNVNPLVPTGASITSFTAAPSTIEVGQASSLEWATTGATSCAATGGTGSDGWNGTQPVSSMATSTGLITVAGTYTYTLTCASGLTAGTPASVVVNVTTAPTPAATIGTFSASPTSVMIGGSTTLSWTSTNASYCTASGGTGSDQWGGAVATSGSFSVGPLSTAGTVAYDLVCTGPGGSSAQSNTLVAVTAPTASQPTVTLLANNSNPAQIQPGQSASFSWTSTDATSCMASGGTGSDGWSGAQATSSTGFTVGPITTPGTYSYTLTCTGTGGTGSSSLVLTVVASNSVDCGVGAPTTELTAPAAQVSNTIYPICLGCSVVDESYLVDSDPTDAGSIQVLAGVLGSISLQVTDTTTTFPAGRKAGFIIADGTSLLSLSALQNVSISTLLGSTVQETATTSNLLDLQALGLLSYDPAAGYVEFTTTKPFNAVAVNVQSLATALTTVKVYGACVSLQ